jgi:hypothetical protein
MKNMEGDPDFEDDEQGDLFDDYEDYLVAEVLTELEGVVSGLRQDIAELAEEAAAEPARAHEVVAARPQLAAEQGDVQQEERRQAIFHMRKARCGW